MFDAIAARQPVLGFIAGQPRARVRNPAIPSRAMGLFGEAIARLPGVARPIIQVISASASRSAMPVARAMATAATGRYGRTLLISSDESDRRDASVRGLAWLMSELSVEAPDVQMPDSTVAGLYHLQLQDDERAIPQLKKWLAAAPDCKVVVLSSPAIAIDPRTIMLGAECNGSILAVTAGVTRADEILGEFRQLSCAGAKVLGTVLTDAPSFATRWPRSGRPRS